MLTQLATRAATAALALALVGCTLKVAPRPPSFDEDLAPHRVSDVPPGDPLLVATRPVATPGKSLRTGTIARERLLAELDAGPPSFLHQLKVAPK
ncbi:MAG TPA: hypothetical protein VNO30_10095 [Kofleriaceae bacterium]|nr:hypothetical protein [Kofleriaceae bacterium]